MKHRYIIFLFALVFSAVSLTPPRGAAGKNTFIRDAEIEITIRDLATPIFRQAGLSPRAVDIHLIRNPGLNAFVAGGQNIFLFTGLIMRTETAEQLLGVIAHESGHIAGGHLVRLKGAQRNASRQALLGLLLGGAALIGGRPDVGAAAIQGGQQLALDSFLGFSRTQEAAADQSAARFMNGSGLSARGLIEFLDVLGSQDLLSVQRRDAYALTHPLSQDRIDLLRRRVEAEGNRVGGIDPTLVLKFDRIRAKLFAFLNRPSRTFRRFPASDQSVAARYARAVAYYRRPELGKALATMDGLIAQFPDDPYFHELKGQMLFENGRAQEAVAPLSRAVSLAPDAALIRTALAHVQLEINDPTLRPGAIKNLRHAVSLEPTYAFAWHQLGIAYGRENKMNFSSLALAEEALLQGRLPAAMALAERARRAFPRGSPDWLRAEDIITAARERKKSR